MGSIAITGWAANDPTPANLVEVSFAQGPASSGTSTYSILLIGNKLAAGSATVDTVYGPDTPTALATLTDAATLFGKGSEAYRMYKRALARNTSVKIYVICPTISVGAQAAKVITVATTALANATFRVHVGDEYVDTAISTGDTPTVIVAAAAANINAMLEWPVTAGASVGALTLTARSAGLRGNWIKVGSVIFGSGVGTTTDTAPMVNLTGGTTADSWTNTLTTINAKRYYYIASADDGNSTPGSGPGTIGSTPLGVLSAQVTSQAVPTTGIRQVVMAGANDGTAANINTIAIALNSARAELYYGKNLDVPPAELAAIMAAASAAWEATLTAGRLNFDGFGLNISGTEALWQVPAPKDGSALTATQIKSALNNGVSPIGISQQGATYLVSRITTKSLTGSTADYRIRDAHKVRVCDRYADDAQTKTALQYAGKAIGDDPLPGQKPPGRDIVTPRDYKTLLNSVTDQYDAAGLIQNVADVKAGTITNRETSPTTRLTGYVPQQPRDVLHQTGLFLAQVA